MANKEIQIKETVVVSDSYSVTSSLNPSVIREEFEAYKGRIDCNSKPAELIVAYLLLQVYIENHFHYYLRFLIGDGFTSGATRVCWNETDYPPQKLSCLGSILEENDINFDKNLLSTVASNYKILSKVRNALAHGHPITKTQTPGSIDESRTKKLLTHCSFLEIVKSTNDLMSAWDHVMSELSDQEGKLKLAGMPQGGFTEHCKFKNPL